METIRKRWPMLRETEADRLAGHQLRQFSGKIVIRGCVGPVQGPIAGRGKAQRQIRQEGLVESQRHGRAERGGQARLYFTQARHACHNDKCCVSFRHIFSSLLPRGQTSWPAFLKSWLALAASGRHSETWYGASTRQLARSPQEYPRPWNGRLCACGSGGEPPRCGSRHEQTSPAFQRASQRSSRASAALGKKPGGSREKSQHHAAKCDTSDSTGERRASFPDEPGVAQRQLQRAWSRATPSPGQRPAR